MTKTIILPTFKIEYTRVNIIDGTSRCVYVLYVNGELYHSYIDRCDVIQAIEMIINSETINI